MRIRMILMSTLLILLLTHCTTYDFSRPVVQQGNLLPQSKLERLKIGMSKEDAAILMGTSLLSPMFNEDRWDYAFTLRNGNHAMQVKNLRLYFNHNTLTRIEHFP